ncbi:hypothetical protein ACI792_01320 [Blastococcus sp. SYSU DS0669]
MLRTGRRPWCLVAAVLLVTPVSGSAAGTSARTNVPDYAHRCLAVGAYVVSADTAPGPALEAFRASADELGPLTIRRSFNPSLPESFERSAAAEDPSAGLRSFVSWKPPGRDVRGAAAGRYDDEVRAWARTVPEGVFATAFHEPENDMSAEEFVALHRHLHEVVTGANPSIRWGPVYMAYWWDPAEPDHYVGDPRAWWPGAAYADFVGVDWYAFEPVAMTTSPSFRHWYDFMAPTGLPLFVVEYGQYELRPGEVSDPAMERARARAIRQDAAWIAHHPQVAMWMYWQGPGPTGDWQLRDEPSRQAWREVAESGCRP